MSERRPPTSESFAGLPDGQTSAVGEALAIRLRRSMAKDYPTTNVRQQGYGPAFFWVQLLDGLVAKVTVIAERSEAPVSERTP